MTNVAADRSDPSTLVLSGETQEALEAATLRLATWMAEGCRDGTVGWPLPELAAALRNRCKPLPWRRAVRVDSWRDAIAALANKSRQVTATAMASPPKLFLSFPGQGSLRPGVLSRLSTGAPAWAAHLARYSNLGRELSGFDSAVWLGDAGADADPVLKDNAKTQLAIFCAGASLGRWLLDLGLRPDGYIGHSLGEWIGANLASALSDQDAIRAVHHRGRLMQATGAGAALIVRLAPDVLAPQLPDEISLACVNAPDVCLISGRPDAIAACGQKLSAAHIITRSAPIHVAVHSPAMDEVVEPFLRELAPLDFAAPATPLLSTVTGEWMTDVQARDREYWARQLRRPVRFDKAAKTLLAEPCAVVLEVGMGAALTSLVTMQARGRANLRALPLLGRDEPPAEGYDPVRVHQALAELWAAGIAIDLTGEVEPTRPAPKLPI